MCVCVFGRQTFFLLHLLAVKQQGQQLRLSDYPSIKFETKAAPLFLKFEKWRHYVVANVFSVIFCTIVFLFLCLSGNFILDMRVTKNGKFIYYKDLQQNVVAVEPTIFQPKQNLMKKKWFSLFNGIQSEFFITNCWNLGIRLLR